MRRLSTGGDAVMAKLEANPKQKAGGAPPPHREVRSRPLLIRPGSLSAEWDAQEYRDEVQLGDYSWYQVAALRTTQPRLAYADTCSARSSLTPFAIRRPSLSPCFTGEQAQSRRDVPVGRQVRWKPFRDGKTFAYGAW